MIELKIFLKEFAQNIKLKKHSPEFYKDLLLDLRMIPVFKETEAQHFKTLYLRNLLGDDDVQIFVNYFTTLSQTSGSEVDSSNIDDFYSRIISLGKRSYFKTTGFYVDTPLLHEIIAIKNLCKVLLTNCEKLESEMEIAESESIPKNSINLIEAVLLGYSKGFGIGEPELTCMIDSYLGKSSKKNISKNTNKEDVPTYPWTIDESFTDRDTILSSELENIQSSQSVTHVTIPTQDITARLREYIRESVSAF